MRPRLRAFEFLNHKIKVKYQRIVRGEAGEKINADCDVNHALILVATHNPETRLPFNEDVLLHNVCHEITHYIFHLSGNEKLYKDEKMVDWVGGLLAQLLRSGRWR